MKPEHRFSIADYKVVTTERESRIAFRQFKQELFEAAFTNLFQDPEALKVAFDRAQQVVPYIFGDLEYFYETTPDMFLLSMAFWEIDGNTMIELYPDLHRVLIGKKDESLEDMKRNNLGGSITEGGVLPKLRDAITTAFIPKSERERYITKEFSQDRRIDTHFAENIPDLSGFQNTEERLDALIKLLSYDITEALMDVLMQRGISPSECSELGTENPILFSDIHQQAGFLYAENNLNGIITDIKHHGENNLFRNRPDLGNLPQTTDTGVCPGDSYAMNYITGLGRSLKKNKKIVLEAITQHEKATD